MPGFCKAVNSIGVFSDFDFYERPDAASVRHTSEVSPLIPKTSLRIGKNVSLFQGNEPQTVQFGGAGLATSAKGGL